MSLVKLKKGLDIKLEGKADKIIKKSEGSQLFAIKPDDFFNVTPKLAVKVDDKVKAGSVLFFDKYNPEVKFTSPVSGTVFAVNRGERRKILEVVVKADEVQEFEMFEEAIDATDAEKIKDVLLKSGLWSFIKQRPYNVIADRNVEPKSIFISAFDSAPLAPDYDYIVDFEAKEFQKGIDTLKYLTSGKINLGVCVNTSSKTLLNCKGVEINTFTKKHPAGNVGTQIHHIDPINKGEVVWTLKPQDVISIGKLMMTGKYDVSRIIALTGSEVEKPAYYRTIVGAEINPIVKGNIKDDKKVRFISGNVLTGRKVESNGFLGSFDSQITVIPEGDDFEFLGWAAMGYNKFSMSNTFLSRIFPKKAYRLDANFHGEVRAFVMSGQYEKVIPMDILPVYLLKAILAEDIDKMEELGIYEVVDEDFALCDFVCTSKIEAQQIIRQGLSLMIKEMS